MGVLEGTHPSKSATYGRCTIPTQPCRSGPVARRGANKLEIDQDNLGEVVEKAHSKAPLVQIDPPRMPDNRMGRSFASRSRKATLPRVIGRRQYCASHRPPGFASRNIPIICSSLNRLLFILCSFSQAELQLRHVPPSRFRASRTKNWL